MKSQQESREIERNEYDIARILYIEPLESRQIERCREVLRFKLRQMHLSSSYPEVSTAKRGSIDRGAIEQPESISMDRSSYRKVVKNVI